MMTEIAINTIVVVVTSRNYIGISFDSRRGSDDKGSSDDIVRNFD